MFKDFGEMQAAVTTDEAEQSPTQAGYEEPANAPKSQRIRRVQTQTPPSPDDNVLIIDSAADQSCIGQGFRILHYTGATIHLDGALDTMGGGNYPLVSAAAVVTDPTTVREIIIIINQAAYNPSLGQHESLLHTEQARHHGVLVNDLASCYTIRHGHPGAQNLEVDGHHIPLHHDGLKYFLHVREPTPSEWDNLPIVELTSPMEWLGSNHNLRRNRRARDWNSAKIKEWRRRFGCIPSDVMLHTLENTTQLVDTVEAETRTTPRRHHLCRLPMLRPRRFREGVFTDTFFPDSTSIRGYNSAQLFTCADSGLSFIDLGKSKGTAPHSLQNFIRSIGVPGFISSDNAPEETQGDWATICRTYCIPQRTSEADYQ